jgi:hypothetical protein
MQSFGATQDFRNGKEELEKDKNGLRAKINIVNSYNAKIIQRPRS